MSDQNQKQPKESNPAKRKYYTSHELGNLVISGMMEEIHKIAEDYKAQQAGSRKKEQLIQSEKKDTLAVKKISMQVSPKLKEIWRKKYRLKRYLQLLEGQKKYYQKYSSRN